ncbi:MAG: hypothetical protein ACREPE_02530 [Lysobacter sp.]
MSKVLKAIGVYEVVGGLFGLIYALVISPLLDAPESVASLSFLAVVSTASLVAGVLLLRSKRAGLLLSRAVQIVQIPVVSVVPVVYYIGLGVFLSVGSAVTHSDSGGFDFSILFEWTIGANYMTALASQLPEQFLAVNAFATAMLVILLRHTKEPSGAANLA